MASAPFLTDESRLRVVGLTGGLISLFSLAVGFLVPVGPGAQEALLILASFGAALAVSAALDNFSRKPLRLVALVGGVAVLVMSVATLMNGRLGLPSGDVNERLSFATTLSEARGPGRILYASADRDSIPGQAVSGPGFWYRVLDGTGTTNDEVWLAPPQEGDDELATILTNVSSGAELRPGRALSGFAIDWVVLEGPEIVLDDAFLAQLDLVPTPLDPDSRVFENTDSVPLAGTVEDPWMRSGTGFTGDGADRQVPLSVSYDAGWGPGGVPNEWSVVVDGSEGRATFTSSVPGLAVPIVSLVLLIGSLVMIGVGRTRS